MILYRTGLVTGTPGEFWTPSESYAYYIHSGGPLHVAELDPSARVKEVEGSPNRAVIARERTIGESDVLVFKAWDWDTDEYIVLNPAVLRLK